MNPPLVDLFIHRAIIETPFRSLKQLIEPPFTAPVLSTQPLARAKRLGYDLSKDRNGFFSYTQKVKKADLVLLRVSRWVTEWFCQKFHVIAAWMQQIVFVNRFRVSARNVKSQHEKISYYLVKGLRLIEIFIKWKVCQRGIIDGYEADEKTFVQLQELSIIIEYSRRQIL